MIRHGSAVYMCHMMLQCQGSSGATERGSAALVRLCASSCTFCCSLLLALNQPVCRCAHACAAVLLC